MENYSVAEFLLVNTLNIFQIKTHISVFSIVSYIYTFIAKIVQK